MIDGCEGSVVKVIVYGCVVYLDWLCGFGLVIIIEYGDGFMIVYGYNQVLFC